MEKKYAVYGIGNAMVDMWYQVDYEMLDKLGIDKGLMTLVDESRQNELLSFLDSLQTTRVGGGSAANTVLATAQLGGSSFYSCKVGNDEYGDFYSKDLELKGVKTNIEDKRGIGVTGKCLVLITPDAERSMNTYLGISETFSKAELIEEELKEAEYLYIEGYLVTSPTGKEAAICARQMARKHNVKVAMSFSDPGLMSYFKEGMDEIMGGKIDLLFCNLEEAKAYAKTSDEARTIEAMKDVAHQFCMTRGEKGALIYDGKNLINIETKQVKAVDTTGAGDLFAGGVLYGITNGYSWEKSGKLGCYAASEVVTQYGARLENEQLSAIKNEVLGE